MENSNYKNQWVKKRHRIISFIAFLFLAPYTRLVYGVNAVKFKEQGKRAYLILMNHQTPFDQFFVGMSFKGAIYYLATEDIFSLGWISSVLRWLVAPIPIKKQTTDITAVRTCMRVAKEGGTIAIAPEGNRTYSGRTEYMNPAIAPLAKKLKLPIALYRIEGGYGVQPRWSDKNRRGRMKAYVSRVVEPEEYAQLTNEELFNLIKDGLYVDEANYSGEYKSNKRAEYIERVLYVCPDCGLTKFESHGNTFLCTRCKREIEYGADKMLHAKGFELPFNYVGEWYDFQKDYINNLDVRHYTDTPLFTDNARLSQVILYKRKISLLKSAAIALYGDRIVINEGLADALIFPFDTVSAVTVLGRNKLNIYHDDKVYQLKGDKRFNALKYVNIYYRYKNINRGDENGKFLGL